MKVRDAVESVAPYPAPHGGRRGKIRLDLNENTRGCSPAVLQALRDLKEEDVCGYPDYDDLIRAIAIRYDVLPESVLLTNGADDAIRAVMQTWVGAGEEVVLTVPGFAMTRIHAGVMGGVLREVVYGPELDYPAAEMLEAIGPSTRLVVVTRPDSPTGAVIEREALIAMLDRLDGGVLLLDETYWHFLGETCVKLIREHPNLVVTQSFSKACGLAGLRLGFLASDPRNIEQLRKVNPLVAARLGFRVHGCIDVIRVFHRHRGDGVAALGEEGVDGVLVFDRQSAAQERVAEIAQGHAALGEHHPRQWLAADDVVEILWQRHVVGRWMRVGVVAELESGGGPSAQ